MASPPSSPILPPSATLPFTRVRGDDQVREDPLVPLEPPEKVAVTMNGKVFRQRDCQLLVALNLYVSDKNGQPLSDRTQGLLVNWARDRMVGVNTAGLFDCIVASREPFEKAWYDEVVREDVVWTERVTGLIKAFDDVLTMQNENTKPSLWESVLVGEKAVDAIKGAKQRANQELQEALARKLEVAVQERDQVAKQLEAALQELRDRRAAAALDPDGKSNADDFNEDERENSSEVAIEPDIVHHKDDQRSADDEDSDDKDAEAPTQREKGKGKEMFEEREVIGQPLETIEEEGQLTLTDTDDEGNFADEEDNKGRLTLRRMK